MSRPLKKAVCFLCNAWSKEHAGRRDWPRDDWLSALWSSRSGNRLRNFTCELMGLVELYWDNTTPLVAASPGVRLDPEPAHMSAVLRDQAPDYVVAFGMQAAQSVAKLWDGPLLAVPHPTYRLLTNKLYSFAGRLMARGGVVGTISVHQRVGFVETKGGVK